MSWQTDITNAVANLTQRLNTITEQARKIFQLPWQSILRSSSKIHVSNDENESEFITIQQIIDAALSFRQNQLLNATIDVDGNDLTVNSGAKWIINNINYELAADFVVNVPYAETGYTRNDILYADQFNQIHRQAGPETEGVSPTPNTPLNTVLVTIISVTDSTIGNTPPIIGSDYELLANKQDSLANDGTGKKYPTVDAVNAGNQTLREYIDSLVTGLLDLRGVYDASSNLFPTTGGSGLLGAVLKGDFWVVSVGGTLSGKTVTIGDTFMALSDSPGQTFSNWAVIESNTGYVSENISNKTSTVTGNESSTTLYLNVSGAWTYFQQKLTDSIFGNFITGLASKTTPVDADSISISDSADSNKQKKVSLTNFKAFLKTYFDTVFQIIDTQTTVSSSQNVQNSWNGKTVIFDTNCTITVPSTLNNQLGFNFIVKVGITVTWAITSPHVWIGGTPPPTASISTPKIGYFTKEGSGNNIYLFV